MTLFCTCMLIFFRLLFVRCFIHCYAVNIIIIIIIIHYTLTLLYTIIYYYIYTNTITLFHRQAVFDRGERIKKEKNSADDDDLPG